MFAYLPFRKPFHHKRQQGMVLILVLLIVALVVGLSVKYASQFHLGMARAESRWASTQAKSLLMAAEEVAILLFPLADIDPSMDYPDEPWNNPVPLTDEGVEGIAQLRDAQAQLNLNDLGKTIDPASLQGAPERYSESQRQLIRLLQTFEEIPLSQQEAENMLEAVVDWLDPDSDSTGSGGAENDYYQGMPESYLAANGAFRSVDELRLVRWFAEKPALVMLLEPYLTVLPKANLGLSVNNIPVENPYGLLGINRLRLSMNGKNQLVPLSEQQAQTFMLSRPETGYANEKELNDAWKQTMGGEELDLSAYKIKTEFFWLESTVQMGDQRRQMRSLMARNTASLQVIQRRMLYELPRVTRGKNDNEDDSELRL